MPERQGILGSTTTAPPPKNWRLTRFPQARISVCLTVFVYRMSFFLCSRKVFKLRQSDTRATQPTKNWLPVGLGF